MRSAEEWADEINATHNAWKVRELVLAIQRDAIESAAECFAKWKSEDAKRLRAGEMSAQECRTVGAVLDSLCRDIRAIIPNDAPEGKS